MLLKKKKSCILTGKIFHHVIFFLTSRNSFHHVVFIHLIPRMFRTRSLSSNISEQESGFCPGVTVTQIDGVTGFIIFPFSALSPHRHYFAFLFGPSLLAFEVADCIHAWGCGRAAASKGPGQGHSVSRKDAPAWSRLFAFLTINL